MGPVFTIFAALTSHLSTRMSDEVTTLKHVINPDQPDAHEFSEKAEIFFQDEFENALISICEHITRLTGVKKGDLEDPKKPLPENERRLIHRHSTIGIFGPRGVGKTSFLLTIKDAFDSGDENEGELLKSFQLGEKLETNQKPEVLRKQVQTLDSIDPSRIENEDKLLITITSKILDHVRDNNEGDLSKNRAIQDALEDLARRFRVLFREATEEIQKDAASDPLRFAGEVLFDADSGPKLADAFHRFVALAADDLGVRCFLLPIDDVDTSFDKGWPLLETLRKYLSTDRLITVVSGDLEFFDLIVEQEAHERTKGYRKAKKDYSKLNLIDKIETRRKYQATRQFSGQYLLKIFPVNDRVRIPNIQSIVIRSRTDLTIKAKSGLEIPFGHAIFLISRLLFGTSYIPARTNRNFWPDLLIRTSAEVRKIETKRISELSRELGPNAIDSLIPGNTRRFISFVEDVSRSVQALLDGVSTSTIAASVRNQIAESHSTLLQTSGIDVEDVARLASGEGFYQLNQTFCEAEISTIDLARLQVDVFKDLPSYDQWRALLVLAASALHTDWSSTMTGMLRYTTKVWDALSVVEQTNMKLDDIGAGLNEPSWKSRVRLLQAQISSIYDDSKDLPETVGMAMRVPRKERYSYTDSDTFINIAPGSKKSPDYMRWWKVAWEKDKGETINARNRAVMPEKKFVDLTDNNASALYGLFRVGFRSGNNSYRYIDFGRGLARIDDLVRGSTGHETTEGEQAGEEKKTDEHQVDEKSEVEVRLDGLSHEAFDFVLQISGDPDEIPGSSATEEEGRKSRNYFGLDKAVQNWVGLAADLSDLRNHDLNGDAESETVELLTGANAVPLPWVVVDAYNRFRTDVDTIADLPWRQQTVGTMLERYTMAFWNALLQKEILSRVKQGLVSESLVTKFDSGPIRDNRGWIARLEEGKLWDDENRPLQNSFTRNVNAVIAFWDDDSNEKRADSLLEVAPYTIFWMSCPFLLSLLSEEIHNDCVVGDWSVFNGEDAGEGHGFLEVVCTSIRETPDSNTALASCFEPYFKRFYNSADEGGENGKRPSWQRSAYTSSDDEKAPRFDIHDIMCGIARPDKAPQANKVSESQRDQDETYLKKLGIIDE